MLRRRDHWLRNLRSADDRAALEAALAAVRREAMARVRSLVPAPEAGELLALATYAADHLAADGRESPIRECADLAALPGAGEADRTRGWASPSCCSPRPASGARQLNENQGFPAGADKAGKAIAKDWKERHAALIVHLARFAESDDLRAALDDLRRLPPARYTDAQWEVLGAIARLLPLAVAELKLVFAARGEADFTEIAQGALARSATPMRPTDLLLVARLPDPPHPRGRVPGHLVHAVRAAGEAHRGLGHGRRGRRRPHALRGRRPDAVDLPLPRGGGRPVPEGAQRRHRAAWRSSR